MNKQHENTTPPVLEQSFQKLLKPVEEFIHDEASGGILLMVCAILAMVMANTGLATMYEGVRQTRLTIDIGLLHPQPYHSPLD